MTDLSWENQEVFSPEQLINFFGLSADELNQLFKDNRPYFIVDKDYFKLINEDAKQFKKLLKTDDKLLGLSFIFLFTESGVQKLIALNQEDSK